MTFKVVEKGGNINIEVSKCIVEEFTAEEIATYIYNQVKERVKKWQEGNRNTTE